MSSVPIEMTGISMMQNAMDGAQLRHEATADNIANVNTPGYKRKEVYFEEKLKDAYMEEDPGDVAVHVERPEGPTPLARRETMGVEPVLNRVTETTMRNDENNVDPDREMVKAAKTSLYYRGLADMTNHQFTMLFDLVSNLGRA